MATQESSTLIRQASSLASGLALLMVVYTLLIVLP